MSEEEQDGATYEWAEFNLPAEAAFGVYLPSPLARRVYAAAVRKSLESTKQVEPCLTDWTAASAAALLGPSF